MLKVGVRLVEENCSGKSSKGNKCMHVLVMRGPCIGQVRLSLYISPNNQPHCIHHPSSLPSNNPIYISLLYTWISGNFVSSDILNNESSDTLLGHFRSVTCLIEPHATQ